MKKIKNTIILLVLLVTLIFISSCSEAQLAQKPKAKENIAIPRDQPPTINDFTLSSYYLNNSFYLTYAATLRDETGIIFVKIELNGPIGGNGEEWYYPEPNPTEVFLNSTQAVGNTTGNYSVIISVTDTANHTTTETKHTYAG